MNQENKKKKIAFVVGEFPVISETFIINQVADLENNGFDVTVFSFKKGNLDNISNRFFRHRMFEKSFYLEMPKNRLFRILSAIPKILKIFFIQPSLIISIFDVRKYGKNASSLKILFWVYPFLHKNFDIVHCHFGQMAKRFLIIKDILKIQTKLITSFYGYDVSMIFQVKSKDYYDDLKRECSLYFVMSNNMKERVVAYGFEENKVKVLPVSIDVESYPFKNRQLQSDEKVKIFSVGRFVEKKGFDDLLRALKIVKIKAKQPFECEIVGGGPLEEELKQMTKEFDLEEIVRYSGYMKIEEVIEVFLNKHLFVQPSKTARNGDME